MKRGYYCHLLQWNVWELKLVPPSHVHLTFPSLPIILPPPPLSLSPENWRAKPCLLVKKSVVNCRLIVLKVLWTSWGSTEPLSSLSRTPPSWGPSQIRSTSWTSSVWKTRKWRLKNKNPKKQTNKKNQTSEALTVDGWVFVMKLMESNLRQKKIHKTPLKKRRRKPLYVTTHMSFWWREDKKGLQLFFNTY